MLYEGKVSTDSWYQVLLLDASGAGQTSKGIGDITVKYHYQESTSQTTYSPAAADWKEAGDGEYWLRIGAAEWYTTGNVQLSIACAGCVTHRMPLTIRTYLIENLFSGNTASLSLQKIEINNAYGTALTSKSTGGNGHGFEILGDSGGNGIYAEGGSNSDAAYFKGGNASGRGLHIVAGTYSNGLFIEGGSDSFFGQSAVRITTSGNSADGIYCEGSGTGNGLHAKSGGGATGDGIYAESAATNGNGVYSVGSGSSGNGIHCKGLRSGLKAEGDTVGSGMQIDGGSTSGHGMEITANGTGTCHGMQIIGSGSNGHGALFKGSPDAGTGKGIYIQGNVSTGMYIEAFGAETGLKIVGGDSGGHAFHAYVDGPGDAIRAEVEGLFSESGNGIHAIGHGTGAGLKAESTTAGGNSGHGIQATSGAGATGDGINATSLATNGNGMSLTGTGTGDDFHADDIPIQVSLTYGRVGTPVALDGGSATIGSMLTKMADDNGGLDFNAEYDSLHEMGDENLMINVMYARLGIPVALDGGSATVSGMLVKIADDYGGTAFNAQYDSLNAMPNLGDMKDLLFTRSVNNRHANEKPQIITAGKGTNQTSIITTIDGSGNIETESHT